MPIRNRAGDIPPEDQIPIEPSGAKGQRGRDRYQINRPGFVMLLDAGTQTIGDANSCGIHDVSRSGALLVSYGGFEVGATIVIFPVPAKPHPPSAWCAKIAHVEALAHGSCRMGVRFISISNALRPLVELAAQRVGIELPKAA